MLELIRGNELLLPTDPPFSACREHVRCGTPLNMVRLDVTARQDNEERMDSGVGEKAPGCGLSAWQVVGGIRIRCDLPELVNQNKPTRSALILVGEFGNRNHPSSDKFVCLLVPGLPVERIDFSAPEELDPRFEFCGRLFDVDSGFAVAAGHREREHVAEYATVEKLFAPDY